MLGNLLQQLYSTVDGIVVGNFVNSTALAAMGSCMSYTGLFVYIAIGLSNGSTIVISQLFGAKRHGEMRRTASTILIMLLSLGVFFTLVCVFTAGAASRHLLRITDDAILRYSVIYISLYSLGLVFQFIYNAVAGILRSVGDSKAVLYFLMVATLANIVLDLLFVAAFRWGVAGAAVATVIAQAACMLVSLRYMFKKYPELRFASGELVFDKEKFVLCVKMGLPTTVQYLIISFGTIALQRLVNSFGSITMAAYTVGTRYDHYVSIPIMSINQAMSAFAGQNTGAGRYDRVKRGLISALGIDLAMVIMICVPLYIFAAPLARLFGVSGEEVGQSVEYLRTICLFFPIFALYIPFSGTFQGCGAPMVSTMASVIALGVRIAGAYMLAYVFHAGYSSCWDNIVYGWTAALIFDIIYFSTGKWKTKSIVRK